MDEARTAAAQQEEYDSQVRRARLGLVAGYIHEMSERHRGRTATSRKPGRPDAPLGSTSR